MSWLFWWVPAALLFFPFLKLAVWEWLRDGSEYPSKGEQVAILATVALCASIWPIMLICLALVGFFYLVRPLFFHDSESKGK